MIWFIVMFIVSMLVLMGVLVYMDEQIDNIPEPDETELENKVRWIKMRISEENFKMGR